MKTFTKLKSKAKAFCLNNKKTSALDKGLMIERWVEEQLKRNCKIIDRNFRSPFGEIDLIIEQNQIVIFVEVRFRKNCYYGDGAESVSKTKQNRIIRSAHYFLQKNPLFKAYPCRFDVISVTTKHLNKKMTWIPAAFEVE